MDDAAVYQKSGKQPGWKYTSGCSKIMKIFTVDYDYSIKQTSKFHSYRGCLDENIKGQYLANSKL